MRASELARLLRCGEGPAIVVAQVGEVNTGAIDPCPRSRGCAEHGACCHVDGAFGLWAAASPALRGLVGGVDEPTRGHRRAQVAQRALRLRRRDRSRPRRARCRDGRSLVRVHPGAAARRRTATGCRSPPGVRAASLFTPPCASSADRGRRARGAQLLMRAACQPAGAEPGVNVLNEVVLNQVLVRFTCDGRTS